VDGVCSLGCDTEADCGAGEVCVAGECKLPDECDENDDCPAGEACIEDTDGHKLCAIHYASARG
jgi:hypothetical protein